MSIGLKFGYYACSCSTVCFVNAEEIKHSHPVV